MNSNANQSAAPVTPNPVPSLPDLLEEIERKTERKLQVNPPGRVCDCTDCDDNREKIALVKALRRAIQTLEPLGEWHQGFGIDGPQALKEIAQLLSDQRDVEGETKLEEEKTDLEE